MGDRKGSYNKTRVRQRLIVTPPTVVHYPRREQEVECPAVEQELQVAEVRHKGERLHGRGHERECRLIGIPPKEGLVKLVSCNEVSGSALAEGDTVCGPVVLSYDDLAATTAVVCAR